MREAAMDWNDTLVTPTPSLIHDDRMNQNVDHLLQSATALQQDIVRTLLYFDIFRHPLRLQEIHTFLPTRSVTLQDIRLACSSEPLTDHLLWKDDLVCLKGQSPESMRERIRKERRANRLWKVAKLMSHIISRFPFVRGVFVSGELSKGVASKRSDIDFFVITAPNRVWITRTAFTLFKRVFLLNRRRLFCYNHITSEGQLEIQDKNIYIAVEVATLKPLHNVQLYEQLISANSWIGEFLPNATVACATSREQENNIPFSERILAQFVPQNKLDLLDAWLFTRWQLLWHRRYPFLAAEKRERLFQCKPQVSTAYVNDFLERIMKAYRQRLDQFGLSSIG